jgi:hypothetical protein
VCLCVGLVILWGFICMHMCTLVYIRGRARVGMCVWAIHEGGLVYTDVCVCVCVCVGLVTMWGLRCMHMCTLVNIVSIYVDTI